MFDDRVQIPRLQPARRHSLWVCLLSVPSLWWVVTTWYGKGLSYGRQENNTFHRRKTNKCWWLRWKEICVYIFLLSDIPHSSSTVVQYKISKTKKGGEFTFSDLFFFNYIPATIALFLNHVLPFASQIYKTLLFHDRHECHNLLHWTRNAVCDYVANSKCTKIKRVVEKASHCKT